MLKSWHVVLRCCARLLLVASAVAYSALASALGLGDITLHSALNQPLRADIALVDAAGLQEGDLSVSLATAAEFRRAGVERVFFLNDLKFTPILRGNRSVIRVSSNKPVNEPFLNFLVQLNQPNGRVLREYTVLIDPPGSPGITPVTDEPVARPQSSAFPSVEPAIVPSPAAQKPTRAPSVEQPPAAPVNDPVAEQLAASVLQNQQLQTTIDQLNARLQTQDEQLAGQKKQVAELQSQLLEIKQTPIVVASPPVITKDPKGSIWPLIIGVLALVALVLLGLFIRRQRQQVQALPEASPVLPSRHEPLPDQKAGPLVQAPILEPAPFHQEETPTSDVLEGVGIYLAYGRFSEAVGLLRDALVKEPQRTDLALQLLEILGKQGDTTAYETQENSLRDAGFDVQKLQEIRARHPKLGSVVPLAATAVVTPPQSLAASDEFQLNLDDLSMDSNWDLVSPFESAQPTDKPPKPVEPAFTSNLHVLPEVFEMPDEPELEWVSEPESQPLDEDFLAQFGDSDQSLQLEPLNLEPTSAGKLEQARTCIDDGDLDSAIALLNELLKDGDEPLKQTARSLLAGIR